MRGSQGAAGFVPGGAAGPCPRFVRGRGGNPAAPRPPPRHPRPGPGASTRPLPAAPRAWAPGGRRSGSSEGVRDPSPRAHRPSPHRRHSHARAVPQGALRRPPARPRPRPRPRPQRPQLPRGRSRGPFPPHPAKIRLKWPPEAAGPRWARPALLSLRLAPPGRAGRPHRPPLPSAPRRPALTMAPGPGAAAAACGAGLLHAESAALRWGRGGRGLGRAGDEPQRPGRAGHMGRAATTCRRWAALGRPPRGRARRRRGLLARPAEAA